MVSISKPYVLQLKTVRSRYGNYGFQLENIKRRHLGTDTEPFNHILVRICQANLSEKSKQPLTTNATLSPHPVHGWNCRHATFLKYSAGDPKSCLCSVRSSSCCVSIARKKWLLIRSCFEFLQKVFLGLMCSFSCVLWAIFWSFPLLYPKSSHDKFKTASKHCVSQPEALPLQK